jgi:hypothetical protein
MCIFSLPLKSDQPFFQSALGSRSLRSALFWVWRDVDYIAEDVTVRHVTLKPAVVPQKRPMGNPVQPDTQRIPPTKVVHAPEKPEIKQISGQHKMCGEEHLGLGRRLVCWLHRISPTHKLPDNSRKEWTQNSHGFRGRAENLIN